MFHCHNTTNKEKFATYIFLTQMSQFLMRLFKAVDLWTGLSDSRFSRLLVLLFPLYYRRYTFDSSRGGTRRVGGGGNSYH